MSDADKTAIVSMRFAASSSHERPTSDLRWFVPREGEPVLQQKWIIELLDDNGRVISVEIDWRPIPTVHE